MFNTTTELSTLFIDVFGLSKIGPASSDHILILI